MATEAPGMFDRATLQRLWGETRDAGFTTTASCSIDQFRAAAQALGWQVATTRSGDIQEELTPTLGDSAARPSLSRLFGLGKQPLHTDGAHLLDPPDVVVLLSRVPNATPTLIQPQNVLAPLMYCEEAMHGVFLVENGASSFLAVASSGGRIRFDPGCMRAQDDRASALEGKLAALSPPVEHHWTRADEVLIIDNRKTMHAREAVHQTDVERTLVRLTYRLGATS